MNNLLHAGFTRVRKYKLFKAAIIIMAFIGIYCPIMIYTNSKINLEEPMPVNEYFFCYVVITAIIASVFCSMFIGTEYSDGTIRNKLIVGHVRTSIYLSNLLLCIASTLIIQIVYMIITSVLGVPLLGAGVSYKVYVKLILGIVLLTICFCSIFTFISMLCQNKAISAITCILGLFILLMVGVYCNERLSEPRYYEAYSYTDDTGTHSCPREKNNMYLYGTKRKVYEMLYDINPAGQILQYTQKDVPRYDRLLASSAIMTIVVSGIGIFLFNKKDIK